MDYTLSVLSKKSLQNQRSFKFSPMLSSLRFIVLLFEMQVCDPFQLDFLKAIVCILILFF